MLFLDGGNHNGIFIIIVREIGKFPNYGEEATLVSVPAVEPVEEVELVLILGEYLVKLIIFWECKI